MERTLLILKPDAVARGISGEILQRLEKTNMRIIKMRMVWLTPKQVGNFYPSNKEYLLSLASKGAAAGLKFRSEAEKLKYGRQITRRLVDYLSMGPVIAVVLEGNDAIKHVRKIIGPTDIANAQPGTIRGDFSNDSIVASSKEQRANRTLVHASDSVETAEKEIRLWFKEREIIA